jgi:YD repeat-containing protein
MYTYDDVGNRETASGVTGTITHNDNNELTLYGDITYDYDANGNMTRKSLRSNSRSRSGTFNEFG